MDPQWIRNTLIDTMRRRRKSLADARLELIQGMRLADPTAVDEVVEQIRLEGQKNQMLDIPGGVHSHDYKKVLTADAKELPWYSGPAEGDEYWPALRARLVAGPMADVVDEIDQASTKVVAHFSDPGIRGLKKKGLVVGYVQSGKTANYTAVMAKAADAGYRTFIVLSGMHNNLRRQTQVRVTKDLGTSKWAQLTNEHEDFGQVLNGSALFSRGVHSVAVVKKNGSRLRRLRDWLRDIDVDVRSRSPILILDDEADQATPNSLAAKDELSRINELLRQIWAEVPTGSYVGYTATPFANVFMDPEDEEELYPSDFILDLPRPSAYFGAERIFGRQSLDDADEPDPGLDMIRGVLADEAKALKPPNKKDERFAFDPALPASLEDAVRWFILATAVRRFRGHHDQHSSMLVHTTAFVAPHFRMKDRLESFLAQSRREVEQADLAAFQAVFEEEMPRVTGLNGEPVPRWSDIASLVAEVTAATRVVVDNGISEDRLDYDRRADDGSPLIETVIAIGGGTLSRGLTLEGLVVSYFTRTSNTYDTLLQMGRWFGYRPGYEDLPRMWLPDDLRQDFEFLALVEEEIRQDMRRLESLQVTPREYGLRVRAHPGRLAITSASKMAHADLVRVSYAGQRHQTIVLHEHETSVLSQNIDTTKRLLARCLATADVGLSTPARTQFFGVAAEDVIEFLAEFQFHPGQPGLRSDHVVGWLGRAAPESSWNVVVLGSTKSHRDATGRVIDLGRLDLGLADELPLVNRSPLAAVHHAANIKALLSQQDWVADFDPALISELRTDGSSYEALRREHGDGSGLLIIYGVSHHSVPLRATQSVSRRAMRAQVPLMGLGIVFPTSDESAVATDADYYSVHPDWSPQTDEEIDLPVDTEGSASLDAASVMAEDVHD